MSFEQKGQYYFAPDKNVSFKVQPRPLGMPSLSEHLSQKIDSGLRTLGVLPRPREITIDDFRRDPITYDEMKILHDALLKDLKTKGAVDIIARETNIDPESWIDHEKVINPVRPPRIPDVWEVDLSGPKFHYIDTPSGHSRWSSQGCVNIVTIPQNDIRIQLSIGEEWDERIVNIRYDRHKELTIQGEETSRLDLSNGNNKYLFQEHLRDAMKNPYNPYWQTKDGFLSPQAFKRHVTQLNASQAA